MTDETMKQIGDEELEKVVGGVGADAGRYAWPVPGCFNILSRFGTVSFGKFNKGIDIGGEGIFGAAVVAAADGTVSPTNYVSSGFGGGYGISCEIEHLEEKSTLYANLSRICVRPGEVVGKGQTIGYVGMTGDVTCPLFHFETRRYGVSYDPMTEF